MRKQINFLFIIILSTCFIWPVSAKPLEPLVKGLPDFTPLVEQTSSSVVKITTTKTRQTRSNREEELLRYFFGDQVPRQQQAPIQSGVGSGFIVSTDGYILTNDHVAADADEITVRLNDGRVFTAELIGSDSQSDVAVLKIEATDLPALPLGNSDELKVGGWVLAIGSPFEFDYSVTAGIVSAKGRSLPGSESFVPFIQTDVAINPGNSGGPLFNMYGEVVGINSQIYSRSGGFMGLSFAIPINVAVNVMEQLKDGGEVKRGWLGILMEPSFNEDPQLAQSLGAINNNGALVKKVGIDSPAEKGGIKAGDIITHVNGELIPKFNNLAPMIASIKPGSEVQITVYRNAQSKILTVKLGEQGNPEFGSQGLEFEEDLLGFTVRELTKKERQLLSRNEQGVVVDEVMSDLAKKEGLEQGDIISMIGGMDIKNVDQFEKVTAEFKKGQRIAMRIIRGREVFFVVLKL